MVFWSKTFKTFQWPPLSETITSEIIRLRHSYFFSKCSKYHAHFRNAIKNREKVFRFSDNSVWSCWRKFCILRDEYLSSEVNVLANSLKIFDQSKAVFFQLNLPGIHGKRGYKWCLATFSGVWNQLIRWLPNGVLKQDFVDVSVAASLGNNNFRNI